MSMKIATHFPPHDETDRRAATRDTWRSFKNQRDAKDTFFAALGWLVIGDVAFVILTVIQTLNH